MRAEIGGSHPGMTAISPPWTRVATRGYDPAMTGTATGSVRARIKRHLMPAMALATFLAAAAPFVSEAPTRVAGGAGLLLLYWLVEWRGIAGDFEDKVPRHALVIVSRALWLPGLVLCVLDALWLHWTPWQGPVVQALGVACYLGGLGLRLWSMRTLGRAFSYDLKVRDGQALVTSGPYARLRHPSYTGLVLWSAGFALWNPSLPGMIVLMGTTVPQIVYRIRVEEGLMAAHFGEAWRRYVGRSWALLPWLW